MIVAAALAGCESRADKLDRLREQAVADARRMHERSTARREEIEAYNGAYVAERARLRALDGHATTPPAHGEGGDGAAGGVEPTEPKSSEPEGRE